MEKTTIFNSVKRKLLEGKQVVGGTIQTPDPNIYLAMANSGFDFIWIEMQHSPMTYQDVAQMIWAGRDSPAIPFIRVPDATEGDIQKATDIGALGIIVPMVNNVSKIEKAIKYSSFPPQRHMTELILQLKIYLSILLRRLQRHIGCNSMLQCCSKQAKQFCNA